MKKQKTSWFAFLVLLFSVAVVLSQTNLSSAEYPQLPRYFQTPIVPKGNLNLEIISKTNLYTGSFTSNYPLAIPPGTNGLQPSIYLNYNSQLASQILPPVVGEGWDISTGYIQRMTNYTSGNSSDDMFILSFKNQIYYLIYNLNDSRYHTRTESFVRILNLTGGNNTLGQYWIVTDRDGTSYRFGFNNDSETLSNLNNYVWRWSLDLTNDTSGNKVFYSYSENPYSNDSGAVYLKKIEYNSDKKRSLEFLYESTDRKDYSSPRLYEGSFVRFSRRLSEINIFANGSLVRKYYFSYNYTLSQTKSFLSSITEYGSDNLSSLPSTAFTYHSENPGFSNLTNWNFPAEFLHIGFTNGGYDNGVRLVDINRDGLVDLVKSYCSSSPKYCEDHPEIITQAVYLNNGSGWYNSSWVLPKIPFAVGLSRDPGARVVDLNGDGLTDIVQLYHEDSGAGNDQLNITHVWINNGTGFINYTGNWTLPNNEFFHYGYVNGGGELGLRLIDLNGDGLMDLAKDLCLGHTGTGCQQSSWINNGSGWYLKNWTLPPVPFRACDIGGFCYDPGVGFADLNGDGLDDIVQLYQDDIHEPKFQSVWINNGTGFINYTGNWTFPNVVLHLDHVNGGSDTGVRIFDINGDGLDDLVQSTCNGNALKWCVDQNLVNRTVWINKGNGWFKDGNFSTPSNIPFVVTLSRDPGTRFADINGDGLTDIVELYNYSSIEVSDTYAPREIWINNGGGYTMASSKNRLGGETTIEYKESTKFRNSGNDSIGDLGFNVWTVRNISENNNINGSQNSIVSKSYNYANGSYDYGRHEFLGFGYTQEYLNNSIVNHLFHQDIARIGLEFDKKTTDLQGNPYSETLNNYSSTKNGGFYIVELISDSELTYDGLISNPRNRLINYTYDAFGNVLEVYDYGDVNVNGDERYEVYGHNPNTDAWIVDKQTSYFLYGPAGDLRETDYVYDDLLLGQPPTRGLITKKEDLLYGENSEWLTTSYGYNSFGNVVNVTDPNGHVTKYVYGIRDSTNTFADRVVNAKGQISNYNFDLGTGNILYQTDFNNALTNYTYDVFGRKTKEIYPYDSAAYPTIEYEYYFDGVAPEEIVTRKREVNGSTNTTDEYTFYDGFGRYIQIKSEFSGSKQVVKDTYYDSIGRVSSQSNPYVVGYYDNYTYPNSSVKQTFYLYDPLDRVVKIINPDGTQRNISYDHWNISLMDENSNKKVYSINAYGKIVEVRELNNGTYYVTKYVYDPANLLTSITDALNHTYNYTYDYVGRKVKTIDPDIGVWNYSYDSVGNLIKQTDNRNITLTFQYDELNRKIKEISTQENITYTYDLNKNGTLSQIKTKDLTTNYTYDDRLRKIGEKKIIDGKIFSTSFAYDSMNRLILKILPDGKSISSSYDVHGLLSSIGGVANLSYNEAQKVISIVYANSLVTNYTYNSSNFRISNIKTGSQQDLSYSYDGAGNILFIKDAKNSKSTTLLYDELNRLIFANITGNGQEELLQFNYNEIGNILDVNGTHQSTFYYNSANPHTPYKVTSS